MSVKKDITIVDIARELNISISTVSRGLKDHPDINKDTRQRIWNKAEQLGYTANIFASNFRKKKTNTLGVIIHRLHGYFISSLLDGMEKVANEAGYNLIISQSRESYNKEMANAKTMLANRVDGLLISLAYDTESLSHIEPFINKGIPVIFFDRVFENSQGVSVIIDNYKNAYDITKHLITEGCSRIMHITACLKRNVYAERYRGYRKALEDFNIPFSEDLLILNDMNPQDGIAAAENILQMENRPDGLFIAEDENAAYCMQHLKKNGVRIPEDIAIAGFNNDPISRTVDPNLTTVNYPAYDIGAVAATSLISQLNGGSSVVQVMNKIVLKSEVIIRESSRRKSS